MNEAQKLLRVLNNEMQPDRSMAEIENAWNHFYAVRTFCEHYHGNDKRIKDAVDTLSNGLSTFTAQKRQNLPSPYTGFRVSISTLYDLLEFDVESDGWPKNSRRGG